MTGATDLPPDLPPDLPEDLLIALARQRGVTLDAGRAAALRPLAESLFGRLARFAGTLPRDAAPPPSGIRGDHEP
jgi:hypothetical protein